MPLRQRVRDPSIDIQRLSRRNKRSRDVEIVSHREEDDGPQFYELEEFPLAPIPATSMETRDWEGANEASPTKKPFKTPLENIAAPPCTAEQSMSCSPGNQRDAVLETVDSTKSLVKETPALQLASVQSDGGQEKSEKSVGLSSGWTVIATGTSEKHIGTEKAVPDRSTEDATGSSTVPEEKAKTLKLKALVLGLPVGASKAQTSQKVQGLTGGVLDGSPGTDEHGSSALESSGMGQPGDSRSLPPIMTQETSSQPVLNRTDALRSNPDIEIKDSPKVNLGTTADLGKDEGMSVDDSAQLVLTRDQDTASVSADRNLGQAEPSTDGLPINSMQNLGDKSVAVWKESPQLTTTSPVGDSKPAKDESFIKTSPVATETNAVSAERPDGNPEDHSPGETLGTATSISLANQSAREAVDADEIKGKSQSCSLPTVAVKTIKESCRPDDENKTEDNRGPSVTGRIGDDATLAKNSLSGEELHERTVIEFSESPKLETTVRAVPIDGVADGTTTHNRSTEGKTSIADSLKPLAGMACFEQASTRMSIDPESPQLYILGPSFNVSDEKVQVGSQHRSESGEVIGARMDESMPVDTPAKNKSEEKLKVKEIAIDTTSPLGYPKEQAIGMEIECDKVETVVGQSSAQNKSLPGGLLPSPGDDETSVIAKTIEHTIMGPSEKRQEPDGPPGGPVASLMQALLVEEIQWELEQAWSAWGKLALLCGPHG